MELGEGGEGRDRVIYAHSKVREWKKKAKGSKVASLPQFLASWYWLRTL